MRGLTGRCGATATLSGQSGGMLGRQPPPEPVARSAGLSEGSRRKRRAPNYACRPFMVSLTVVGHRSSGGTAAARCRSSWILWPKHAGRLLCRAAFGTARSPDRYRSVPRAVSTGVSSAPNPRSCHVEEAKVMLCGYLVPVAAHCRPTEVCAALSALPGVTKKATQSEDGVEDQQGGRTGGAGGVLGSGAGPGTAGGGGGCSRQSAGTGPADTAVGACRATGGRARS
jgi:hypothetical protein